MALSDNARGALLMIGSMTAFTFNDAAMKSLAGELPIFQAIFLRGLAASLCLWAVVRWSGGLAWPRNARDRWLLALRSGCEMIAAYFFITALFNMPIANASAIINALPLTVTLAGALVFRERVGWRRWSAILLGFAGVMLIVRPGTDGFTIYSLYVLLAVFAVTVRDLASRAMSTAVSSGLTALAGSIGVTVFGGLAALTEPWDSVSLVEWAILATAAIFVVFAYLLSVMTMRVGDMGFIAPFRYTSLVVAILLGIALFAEWPDFWTLTGAALIVGTGLFTFYRSRAVAVTPPP